MTEPHRQMLGWLLDSLFDEIVRAISNGRGLSRDRVRELLDAVPMTAEQASVEGFLDVVCYEDELATYLGTPETPELLIPWPDARKRLIRSVRWHGGRAIGVISLEG